MGKKRGLARNKDISNKTVLYRKFFSFFPHKSPQVSVSAIKENQSFTLSFQLKHTDNILELQKVLWLWLNFGTLGRRSRRGYGSLLWIPEKGDLLDGFIDFNPAADLITEVTSISLHKYLLNGLNKILGPAKLLPNRKVHDWFQLYTSDQVFIGNKLSNRYDNSKTGMEYLLHGVNEKVRGTEGKELGYGSRLSSPLFWRLFPVDGDCSGSKGYIPVVIWSPRFSSKISINSGIDNYLKKQLGIRNSLAERSLNI